jgi:hypothetical protein
MTRITECYIRVIRANPEINNLPQSPCCDEESGMKKKICTQFVLDEAGCCHLASDFVLRAPLLFA